MVKISELSSATPTTSDSVAGISASGPVTKRFTLTNLISLFFANMPPVVSITTATTITPTLTQSTYAVTALATAATIAVPSGTPVNGQPLILRIKDAGSAQTLTWNSIYRGIGVTLPTATVASKTLYVGMKYNSADSKWDCIGVGRES